jgi:hypothetical protein
MGSRERVTEPTGGLVTTADGTTWYRITGIERMDPFLLMVVSDDDLWMSVSSAGPLTAGRVDADHALLPYETDDRLHRAAGVTGPVSVVARTVDGHRELWRPFDRTCDPAATRSIARSVLGNAVMFDEYHAGWGLRLRATWAPSRAHGWVRTVELVDEAGAGASVEVLDGLLDVMPTGVEADLEQRRSNLVDAYKRSEVGPWGTLATFGLESRITDRAEPAEALAATVVWSSGLVGAQVLLDEHAVADMVAGRPSTPKRVLTGRRGAYLLRADVELAAGGTARWQLVADVGLGQAAVLDLLPLVHDPVAADVVDASVAAGTQRLRALLADADGFQTTADPVADAHHLSNVLFNAMRGGIFPHGHEVPTADLRDFLRTRNRPVAERFAADVPSGDGPTVPLLLVRDWAVATGDPDVVRLVLSYLPLAFSRRHGDPSRPWNRFSIRVRDHAGDELLTYEGNWRDIFQNWEALLASYPAWTPHVVTTFVGASTPDGHNPYRITRDGIDWEVPDPDDPWSNIGYWGDHQLVYLLRLLRLWDRVDPDGPGARLDEAVHTYADVPYTLADHEAMLADPRNTIVFDEPRAAAVAERVAAVGSDGRLVVGPDGALVRVTLLEKLLVPALAKLSAWVPGGGIWMNTQRPEWNDANNALVGHGLSMVTLHHLEQYLTHLHSLLEARGAAPVRLTRPVVGWLAAVSDVLTDHAELAGRFDDETRRAVLDQLGRAGAAHRAAVAAGFDPTVVNVDAAVLQRFVDAALPLLAADVRGAGRPDGLRHAYNLVGFPGPDRATVEHLPAMLEGQVAAIGSPSLSGAEAAGIVEALFASALHREDLGTFLLYPGDLPPGFLERNRLPDDALERVPALDRLVGTDPDAPLARDHTGGLHFRPAITNAADLAAVLARHDLRPQERADVLAIHEEVFDHHAFTGRSSGMHGYEGLGSVYWHMVSKLLLAVQERYRAEEAIGSPSAVLDALRDAYRRVRDGLGSRHDPATFGAVPTDCYSHTPAHAGAQQPGMTGQVKEEVLARPGELGLVVDDGRLRVERPLLPSVELVGADGSGRVTTTVCATRVTIVAVERDVVRVTRADGEVDEQPGAALDRAASAAVLGRTGEVVAVEFATTLLG